MINFEQWEGFEGRIWKEEVNVRDFIQKNYTPYDGDESFLAGPTEATDKLWGALQKLQKAKLLFDDTGGYTLYHVLFGIHFNSHAARQPHFGSSVCRC